MYPLVLLPGMNCTADLWTGVFCTDADLGEVIAPTLREQSMTAQVDALLAELPDTFVLAGLSLGAVVAMALVEAAPKRVAGLCVISTNAKAPTPAQQQGWVDWTRRLDEGETARDMQKSILSALLSPRALRQHLLVDRVLAMADATGTELVRAQLQMQITRVDLLAGLTEVDVPTLVICGEEDTICPPGFHTEIALATPRARLILIKAGHLLPMERPEELGRIMRFWRSGQHI